MVLGFSDDLSSCREIYNIQAEFLMDYSHQNSHRSSRFLTVRNWSTSFSKSKIVKCFVSEHILWNSGASSRFESNRYSVPAPAPSRWRPQKNNRIIRLIGDLRVIRSDVSGKQEDIRTLRNNQKPWNQIIHRIPRAILSVSRKTSTTPATLACLSVKMLWLSGTGCSVSRSFLVAKL